MSNFDEFNARVERAKIEADKQDAFDSVGSHKRSYSWRWILGGFLFEFLGTMIAWLVIAVFLIAALAVSLGVNFWVALGILALVFVAGALLSGGANL